MARNRCQGNRGIPQRPCREDMPRKSLDIRFTDHPIFRERAMPLSLLPARMGAGKARYRVKGFVPCGFLGQGPKPSESIGSSFLSNIYSFQGSKEPFSLAQFFS